MVDITDNFHSIYVQLAIVKQSYSFKHEINHGFIRLMIAFIALISRHKIEPSNHKLQIAYIQYIINFQLQSLSVQFSLCAH